MRCTNRGSHTACLQEYAWAQRSPAARAVIECCFRVVVQRPPTATTHYNPTPEVETDFVLPDGLTRQHMQQIVAEMVGTESTPMRPIDAKAYASLASCLELRHSPAYAAMCINTTCDKANALRLFSRHGECFVEDLMLGWCTDEQYELFFAELAILVQDVPPGLREKVRQLGHFLFEHALFLQQRGHGGPENRAYWKLFFHLKTIFGE